MALQEKERVMPFCTLFFKGRGRELNILSIYTMTWYICMYVPSVVCNSTEVYIHTLYTSIHFACVVLHQE